MKTRHSSIALALVAAMTLVPTASMHASATVPEGFAEELVARDLPDVTVIRFLPDGAMLVAEKLGGLWMLRDGHSPRLILDLEVDAEGERGLVGLAIDPAFDRNGYIYLHYTATEPTLHNRVSRFVIDGDAVDRDSEKVLIELPDQDAAYHVGGGLAFLPDRTLLIGVGENTKYLEAQSLTSLRGKILRVNTDGSVPDDNPFLSETAGLYRTIWAVGVRNPFTIDVGAHSGRVMINDTGEALYEEVNVGEAGANYGWPDAQGPTELPGLRDPLHAYEHGEGDENGCAIDGGVLYETDSPTFPEPYRDNYFFIDYCASSIRLLDVSTGDMTVFARGLARAESGISQLVALELGPDGALYWASRAHGTIYRIQYTGDPAPRIGQQPESRTVALGERATFEVRASGADPLHYQWQENGVEIPGATEPVLNVWQAVPEHDGSVFRCVVGNEHGSALTEPARLRVALPQADYEMRSDGSWETRATHHYSMLLTNEGAAVWPADGNHPVRLAVHMGGPDELIGETATEPRRFNLPSDVAPGESVEVSIELEMPSEPGQYVVQHRLVMEGIAWFEDSHDATVVVERPLLERLPKRLIAAASLGVMAIATGVWLAWRWRRRGVSN